MSANSHKAFLRRLDQSRLSTFLVAEFLHKRGYTVVIPAFNYPPPNSNWEDHVDDGDLFISKDNEPQHRIDVKHINVDFTCADDFPHSHMFVADARAIKRANPHPLAYIIVNKSASHVAIVWWKTIGVWEEHTVFASNTEKHITVMRCPVEHVDFRTLDVRGLND